MKANYKILEEKIIHEGFLTLRIDHLAKDDQSSLHYHVILTKSEAVAVIAKKNDDLFLITSEYRHPIKKSILGCPGGCLEKNEDPIEAAKRELQEETGYVFSKWTYLGASYFLPSICEQKLHFVLAESFSKKVDIKQDPFENISTLELSEEKIKGKILDGFEVDGTLLAALNFYNIFQEQKIAKKL